MTMQILMPTTPHCTAWHCVGAASSVAPSTVQVLSSDALTAQASTLLVLPWSWLSWHRLTLPPNSHRQLTAIAQGLLEESLLDAPETLHLSFEPNALLTARRGGAVWVAACQHDRLQLAWQTLATKGCLPERIVPELGPTSEGLQWHWVHTPTHAMRVAQSPLGLFAVAASVPLLPTPWLDLTPFAAHAEPDLIAHAEQDLERMRQSPAYSAMAPALAALTVRVQDLKDRLMAAAQSPWDLAQGTFKRQVRWVHQIRATGHWLRHAPEAALLRWGAVALVSLQLLGWGVFAVQQMRQTAQLQARIDQHFAQALPQTPQLDAPSQMAQALRQLELQNGVPSSHDLGALLAAWGQALPEHPIERFNYSRDVLQVQDLSAAALEAARSTNWAAQGLEAHLTERQVSLRVAPVAPVAPVTSATSAASTPNTASRLHTLSEKAQTVQALHARMTPLREQNKTAAQVRAALQTLSPVTAQQGEWRFSATEGTLQAKGISSAQLSQWLVDWPAHARVSVTQAQAQFNSPHWQVQLVVPLPPAKP